MLKKLLLIIALLFSSSIVFLAACGTAASGSSTTGNQVHMSAANFDQPSITIKKGQSITLVDDSFVPHTIANGTWENGSAKAMREPGAPAVSNVQVGANGQSTIGPFATSGTFKLYCTIHSGMNLTVVVQ